MEKKIRTTKQTRDMDQDHRNEVATALSQLFGAKVVPQKEFEESERKNAELLEKVKSSEKKLSEIYPDYLKYYCLYLGYKKYHAKWKPFTRKIERKTNKLSREKLLFDFEGKSYPEDVIINIKEAYNCYINGLNISCYVMLLRTIEISANHIYDPIMNPDKTFVPAKAKLDWLKKNKYVSGADYFIMKGIIDGRNEAIHEVFNPTEKQMMSVFETVLDLIQKINKRLIPQ
jgi:hypothetical protein